MKLSLAYIIIGIGTIVGLVGGFLVGDYLQDAPSKVKYGVTLGMIGVTIIGFAMGCPTDKQKDDNSRLSS